ncbi:MAG TPA: aminotransferase class V-fold PLP-dependent enzyme [Ktedonobacterales bacterium]|nr:aminotransferase class V-fold PLP-dependent enzyme [Ktedonobacterales bacterium]
MSSSTSTPTTAVPDPAAQPIYLEYNATTPLDPAVVRAMRPYLEQQFGNPSSGHAYGHESKAAVDEARTQVASLLGCEPEEVVFTGSGSESDNYALKGIAFARRAGHG